MGGITLKLCGSIVCYMFPFQPANYIRNHALEHDESSLHGIFINELHEYLEQRFPSFTCLLDETLTTFLNRNVAMYRSDLVYFMSIIVTLHDFTVWFYVYYAKHVSVDYRSLLNTGWIYKWDMLTPSCNFQAIGDYIEAYIMKEPK